MPTLSVSTSPSSIRLCTISFTTIESEATKSERMWWRQQRKRERWGNRGNKKGEVMEEAKRERMQRWRIIIMHNVIHMSYVLIPFSLCPSFSSSLSWNTSFYKNNTRIIKYTTPAPCTPSPAHPLKEERHHSGSLLLQAETSSLGLGENKI